MSALLDFGAGSSYASAALLEKIRARSHRSGVYQIEMMLGTVKQPWKFTESNYTR